MNPDHFWNLLAKKLAGEATPNELAELEELIKAYPELSIAAQQVSRLWQMEAKPKPSNANEAFEQHLRRLQGHGTPQERLAVQLSKNIFRRPAKKWLVAGMGACLLIAAVAGIFFLGPTQQEKFPPVVAQTEEVYTRPGTRTKMVLPDKTIVWLNAGSRLVYTKPFGAESRNVTLNGEAYFDVTKSKVPFVISTNGVRIKVLGTAFNVRSYAGEKKVETSLVHGQVEVLVDQDPGKRYLLKPNEKLTLNTTESSTRERSKKELPLAIVSTLHYLDSNTIAETSWVENKLAFDDETFTDIAMKMERWYGVSIHFKNERIKTERFTGVFEKETVWQALEALQLTTPFQFTHKNNEIIITQ